MSESKDSIESGNNYSSVSVNIEPVIVPQEKKTDKSHMPGYKELVAEIEIGLKAIEEGRVISHEVMIEKLKRYANED